MTGEINWQGYGAIRSVNSEDAQARIDMAVSGTTGKARFSALSSGMSQETYRCLIKSRIFGVGSAKVGTP